VIVAEEITARFFNVISLFNGFIPIIAIQMSAIEFGDAVTLVFSTVFGRISWGSKRTNRNYWQSRDPRRHWRSPTTC